MQYSVCIIYDNICVIYMYYIYNMYIYIYQVYVNSYLYFTLKNYTYIICHIYKNNTHIYITCCI